MLPVRTYVKTSGFGMRWGKLHAGEDFAAPIGTPVHAISSGVVVFAGVENGYGNKIEIRHWDGTCSWYGHLSKIDVKVGQKVDPAELIGLVGNTGHSTGPHLHLEIHPHGDGPVDPLPWLRAHGLKPLVPRRWLGHSVSTTALGRPVISSSGWLTSRSYGRRTPVKRIAPLR